MEAEGDAREVATTSLPIVERYKSIRSLLSSLHTIIETLFAALEEDTNSSTWMAMLNELCSLCLIEEPTVLKTLQSERG